MKTQCSSLFILLFSFLVTVSNIYSQGVAINSDGGVPHNTAILDLQSESHGFLLPRMSSTERDAIVSPAVGLMIYNTDTKCLDIFSFIWNQIWCFNCIPPNMPTVIVGDTIVCPGHTYTYAIAAVNGASDYTWSVPTGWIINSGQGTTSISVTTGNENQSGIVSVIANNSCGNSPPQNLVVNIVYNAGVIGIQVRTGFYGYSAGSYSIVNVQFDQAYSNVVYVSNCSGSCTCSGTGTTFHMQTSGGTCLGTGLIVRNFEFSTLPTSATITMVGQGVHTYFPRFYWILSDGTLVQNIANCDNSDPYIYNTWNETNQCTFTQPCP